MEATRGSISSASTAQSTRDDGTVSSEAFILRHGRRYLRNVPHYPLPCDLPELQRQNLQTLLATSVFDRALGHTPSPQNPPKKVLEMACGSGYYSAVCHDFLGGLGYDEVSFTGLDVVPVAGDLQRQGIDWRFVQHDLRKYVYPGRSKYCPGAHCEAFRLLHPIESFWLGEGDWIQRQLADQG